MIRKMRKEDMEVFLSFTEMFYTSDAVLQPIPQSYHIDAFEEIMRSDIYLDGYIFEFDTKPVGYAMTAKTYSHEAGGLVLWIEELYVLEEYQSKGIGREFFRYIKSVVDTSIVRLRLEVESENTRAIKFYKKMGFNALEYDQMIKDLAIYEGN